MTNAPQAPESIRILVIDDEEGMREGMRRVLAGKGFAVRTAGNGESAMQMLDESPCDIALVDLKMPGIDGFRVTEHITEKFGSRTVVVIVSALATVDAAVEVTRHGAFDFLVKPFTPGDLMMVVERAVRQRQLIQEREKFLSELASERNLSSQMITSMSEGVVVFNIRREPVLMNPRAEHFLGMRFDESLTLEKIFPAEAAREAVEAAMGGAEGRPETRSAQLVFGDGAQGRMLNLSATPLLRDGGPGGAIVILTDITDSWKAEQDKNRFVSMVAHELKSPLSAILNYINVIQTGMFDANPAKVHEMLERCKVRGEALLDLIRDLLYINRKDAGKVERCIEDLDLKAVLAAQLEFFRVQADKHNIEVKLTAPLESYPIKADRGDLDRVFMNLQSNGIKYNRDGGKMEIEIANGGPFWNVAVRDTGIGMTPAEIGNLFQEFYRVKSQKTSGIAGTGLGLATVKRVLGEYGAEIAVESTPGAGSVFTVSFPKATDG